MPSLLKIDFRNCHSSQLIWSKAEHLDSLTFRGQSSNQWTSRNNFKATSFWIKNCITSSLKSKEIFESFAGLDRCYLQRLTKKIRGMSKMSSTFGAGSWLEQLQVTKIIKRKLSSLGMTAYSLMVMGKKKFLKRSRRLFRAHLMGLMRAFLLMVRRGQARPILCKALAKTKVLFPDQSL